MSTNRSYSPPPWCRSYPVLLVGMMAAPAAADTYFNSAEPICDSSDPTILWCDDIEVTDRLVRAGELLGVHVLDHVIIGSQSFHSFARSGQLVAQVAASAHR